MGLFRVSKCTICHSCLRSDNVYTLKCNHTFHHECVTRWISEGSKTCPYCRVPAILSDIKKLYIEEACDSFDESGDEFAQGSSNMTTRNLAKIQQTNSDNENKILKLISEHEKEIKSLKHDIQQLKAINDIKDEKINSLEEEIKKNFVGIKNKWKEIDSQWKCCDNKCINTDNPIGNCVKGNGFVNIINDENIKYIKCVEWKGGYDHYVRVYAQNSFTKSKHCFNYSLYYFEIKCNFEDNSNMYKCMHIGLNNTNDWIGFSANYAEIYNEKAELFKLSTSSWKNNDIFGCGLVYPPTNKMNEFPYFFYTQNGKQIGKGILLKENFDSYKPFVELIRCSVEANFGNNLETKPFNYDISNHSILKEFY